MNVPNNRKTKKQAQRLEKNVQQQNANKTNVKKDAKNANNTATAPKQGVKATLLQKMFGTKKAPQTAQQSIPYHEIYRDGICRVNERLFTKTITFGDINYQLAQNEDKTQIFEGYCDFLNCATRSHTNTIPQDKILWANSPCGAKNGGLPVVFGSNNLFSDEWNDGVTP